MRYLCGADYHSADPAGKAEMFAWHCVVLGPALDGLAALPALARR